jgi:hypothetical protein
MRVPSDVSHGGSGSVAAASDGEAAIAWGGVNLTHIPSFSRWLGAGVRHVARRCILVSQGGRM